MRILGMVDEALRARLEKRIMEHRQYHSEFVQRMYDRGEAEGEAKGEVKGEAKSILMVLTARAIPVSDAVREKILGCTDVAVLDVWLKRAAVSSTAAAVVRATSRPRPPAKPAHGAQTAPARRAAKRPARRNPGQ